MIRGFLSGSAVVVVSVIAAACGGSETPAPAAAPPAAAASAPAAAPKPAGVVTLIEPNDGAMAGHIDTFRWSPVEGADGYVITIKAVTGDRVVWESAPLTVTDTGVGIPEQHLPHVFDRFYKADESRSGTGSGLGLSIVKAIVERHGGAVSARSRQGVETTFEIVLPQERGKDAL